MLRSIGLGVSPRKILFNPGLMIMTRGISSLLERNPFSTKHYLFRHLTGDWGDVHINTWSANNRAIKNGDQILSFYDVLAGRTIAILTNADRSNTTIMLPEEL
jgi:hypothetical protein